MRRSAGKVAQVLFLPTAGHSAFLKQLRQHEPSNQALQAVAIRLCLRNDRAELLGIVNSHDPSQGVGGQLLEEGFGQAGVVFGEQFLELRGAGKSLPTRQNA